MTGRPVETARFRLAELGLPCCGLGTAQALYVGTWRLVPTGGLYALAWTGRPPHEGTHALHRYDGATWQPVALPGDPWAVVALAEDGNGTVWAVACRAVSDEWETILLQRPANGEWQQAAAYRHGGPPSYHGNVLPTDTGVFVALQGAGTLLWRGTIRRLSATAVVLAQTREGSLYGWPQPADWQGPHVYWLQWDRPEAMALGPFAWRGRVWAVTLRQGPDADHVVLWRLTPGEAVEAAAVNVHGYAHEAGYTRGVAVPTQAALYLLLRGVRVPAPDDRDDVTRLVAWDGRLLRDLGPAGVIPWTEPFATPRGYAVVATGLASTAGMMPYWLETTDPELGLLIADTQFAVLRWPQVVALDLLELEYGDGSGQAKPALDWLEAAWGRIRPWNNRPCLDAIWLEYGDGSGTNRPSLDSIEVAYSDGSGAGRPALDLLELEFAAGAVGEKELQRPRLDMLQAEYGRCRFAGPEPGQKVLLFKPIDAREAFAVRLVVPHGVPCKLLVRVNAEDRPPNDWASYSVYEPGETVILPDTGTVRLGILSCSGAPDSPPDAYIQLIAG